MWYAACPACQGAGLKLAVLSNKQHLATTQLVPHFFAGVRFDAIYGNRPDWPRKPDPTAALAIADELGVAWNDPAIDADWGLTDPILSNRDQTNPLRSEIEPMWQPHYQLRP